MLLMKESVLSFEENTHTHTQTRTHAHTQLPWFTYSFKLPASTKQSFKTNPLNIIFNDFSI